MMFKKGL